jgi:hypothetical protein
VSRSGVAALALALAIVAMPAAGRADDWRGGGSLSLDLRGSQMEAEGGERTRAVTAGPRVRAVGGKSAVGLAAGVDLDLGATGDGDFAYEVAVLPVGVGLLLGSARIGVVAGAGTSGITGGALPIALAMPVESFAEVSLGSHLRASAWGRVVALVGSDGRQSGAEDAPFGDELEIGLTLRWDRRRSDWSFVAGNGYQLGAAYGQVAGAEVVSILLGYSLDAASARREPIGL